MMKQPGSAVREIIRLRGEVERLRAELGQAEKERDRANHRARSILTLFERYQAGASPVVEAALLCERERTDAAAMATLYGAAEQYRRLEP